VKTYPLKFETLMPTTLDKAWDFFSSPNNLAKITPPDMNFVVTSANGPDTKMYPGMIIIYKVSPLWGIKLNWMTEITQVKEKEYFVDEQRFGPYALWHHEHRFREIKGGVHMTDILYYAIPYGFIGRIANGLLVKGQIKKIFEYREEAIEHLFGTIKK
jgi:ligand-binding SRPBCC domain-containing protein